MELGEQRYVSMSRGESSWSAIFRTRLRQNRSSSYESDTPGGKGIVAMNMPQSAMARSGKKPRLDHFVPR